MHVPLGLLLVYLMLQVNLELDVFILELLNFSDLFFSFFYLFLFRFLLDGRLL
jgi:hypothetical protein